MAIITKAIVPRQLSAYPQPISYEARLNENMRRTLMYDECLSEGSNKVYEGCWV